MSPCTGKSRERTRSAAARGLPALSRRQKLLIVGALLAAAAVWYAQLAIFAEELDELTAREDRIAGEVADLQARVDGDGDADDGLAGALAEAEALDRLLPAAAERVRIAAGVAAEGDRAGLQVGAVTAGEELLFGPLAADTF